MKCLHAWKVKGSTARSLRNPAPYMKEAERQTCDALKSSEQLLFSIPDEAYPTSVERNLGSTNNPLCVGRTAQGRRAGNWNCRNAREHPCTAELPPRNMQKPLQVRRGNRSKRTCAWSGHLRTYGSHEKQRQNVCCNCFRAGLHTAVNFCDDLPKQISQQGAVITEYPFGVKAMPAYFPQRNRIISGLSKGTVVVESGAKGGALITARFALDQNREIFAVPGPISSPKSAGTNNLIRTDRARLTQTPEDVLDALGYHISLPDNTKAASPTLDLSLFEQQVYDLLSGEPTHADELCESSGLSPSDLLVTLLNLEFKGLARQMAGKMFLRG